MNDHKFLYTFLVLIFFGVNGITQDMYQIETGKKWGIQRGYLPEDLYLDSKFGYLTREDFNEVSVVSEAQAQKLMKNIIVEEKLPIHYKIAGCESIAHKIAIALENKNIFSAKIFAGEKMKVKINNVFLDWTFHVAVLIAVKKENLVISKIKGKSFKTKVVSVEPMVLDPAFFTKPVSIKTWIRILGLDSENQINPLISSPKQIYLMSRYLFTPYKDSEDLNWVFETPSFYDQEDKVEMNHRLKMMSENIPIENW